MAEEGVYLSDQRTVAVWQLWDNPIFRRYVRSRLRVKTLVPWLLVVGIATAFVFLFLWVGLPQWWRDADRASVARVILIVLIPIQGMLMLLMGTGAVASGVMLESADGGIEYQRLTPLSPLTKIAGYLFGLPVREYCLFLATLPFTLVAMAVGKVPVGLVLSLYIAFFTSALLYHLSGCVAGMVVNRRFAGRIAQLMVIVLYLVLPQIAKFGFEFFSYLTILPVLSELIGEMQLPGLRVFFDGAFGTGSRSVSLFGMEVEALPFTLLIQGTMIVTFVVVLFRKWRQPTHHMLGKNFAAGLCLWIHVLLLGSTIPLIDSGEIFPARPSQARLERERFEILNGELNTRERKYLENRWRRGSNQKDPRHAYWLTASYGIGALILSCGLVLIITPSRDEFTKGLRRARKLGRRRVPLNADGASAQPHVLLIGLIGVVAWAVFASEMFGSHWFGDARVGSQALEFSSSQLRAVPFSQLLFVLCFWAVLEWGERRSLLLFVLFVWIVPVLAAMIFLVADFGEIAVLLGGVSAFPGPFYALSLPVNYPSWYMQLMGQTFIAAAALYSLLVLHFIRRVKRRHREIVARVEAGDGAPPLVPREINS